VSDGAELGFGLLLVAALTDRTWMSIRAVLVRRLA